MDSKLMDQLREEFPEFLKYLGDKESTGHQMRLVCYCDDGWYELIRYGCQEYQEWAKKHNNPLTCVSIKEKFGSLVIYWRAEHKMAEGSLEELWKIDREVSNRSLHTCEKCGHEHEENSNEISTRESKGDYWVRTLCNSCRRLMEKEKEKKANV